MPSSESMHDFYTLFLGNESAYGVFTLTGEKDENGKALGVASTERKEIKEQDYVTHLSGKRGIGVVPIRSDAKCSFGVIDVDDASLFKTIPPVIRKHGFPLVSFRSKSGGLHLFIFFERPESAAKVIALLRTYRRALGLSAKTEIFPKQAKLEPDAVGNWINLPYFNCDKTDRYAIGPKGEALSLDEAVSVCAKFRTSLGVLSSMELPLMDAPPCLQAVYLRGSTVMRNNYLFSQAVYLKNKYGDEFEQKLVEINAALEVPLSVKEISDTIINSIKRKDYAYKCSEEPLSALCDKTECKKRKYGVGSAEVPELSFEQLTQFLADPPYYEWMVNQKNLRFYSETDIINQFAFRTLCFRIIHILPMRLKDETWTRVVNTALQNIKTVAVDQGDDISIGATFKEYLVEFLTKRAKAANREQLLMDRVLVDEELSSFVFRAKNLMSFLIVQKTFRAFGQTEIQARLRDLGGKAMRYYVNRQNSSLRVWSIPISALEMFVEPDIDQVDVNFMEVQDDDQY